MDNTKKILGLDIGTTSIGWAIVEAKEKSEMERFKKMKEEGKELPVTDINNDRIGIHFKDGKAAVGVRIIKQDTASKQQFEKGLKLNTTSSSTPTATRRTKRGSRRLKSRYKLRRQKLTQVLECLGMTPNEAFYTKDKTAKRKGKFAIEDIGEAIYELRDRAIREEITLAEWGRIMLHLNQWRGYSSDRFTKAEKEETNVGTTARITSIEKSEDYNFIREVKKKIVETIYDTFIIEFDNGEKGIIVRAKDNDNFDFTIGKLCTYKFKDEVEINGCKQVEKKNLNENSWAFKKDKINSSIEDFCNNGGTVGSYFYQHFYGVNKSVDRIRTNIVNRNWYEEEFDKIFALQYERHQAHFNNINIEEIVASAFHKVYNDGSENKTYTEILCEVKKNGKNLKEQIHYLITKVIIYYQRPWQQAKNKGECTFEKVLVKVDRKNKETKEIEKVEDYRGRTVIPRSHPLHQEFKIWNQINNVKLFFNNHDVRLELLKERIEECKNLTGFEPNEIKELLYNELNTKGEVNWRTFTGDLLKDKYPVIVIGLGKYKSKEEKDLPEIFFTVNYTKRKRKTNEIDDDKLKGNKTLYQINKILEFENKDWYFENHTVSKDQTVTNLQLLWEIIYDINISDISKVSELIQQKFSAINKDKADKLSKIKFDDSGMGQLSAKAIRNLLPLMSNGIKLTDKAKEKIESLIKINEKEKALPNDEKLKGLKDFFRDEKTRLVLADKKNNTDFKYLSYTEATAIVYGSHSSTGIKGNNKAIETVRQHSMNNPVVEKIVNETIRIVNDIYKEYGFDEVRIELSRELKASAEEREQMTESIKTNTEKIEWAKQMLREIKGNAIQLDTEASNKNNLDKIRIYEDVVKELKKEEYKTKIKEYKLDEPSKAEVNKYLLWLEQNFKCPYTGEPIPLTDVFAKNKLVEIEHILPRQRYPNNAYSNKVITWEAINKAKADNGNRTAYEFIVSKRTQDKFKLNNSKEVNLIAKENWEEYVKTMFQKGSKRNNLLRKEIPDNPIERTLKETQYINKKLKEKLGELVGSDKVWVTSGSVTDILRNNWSLNEVMKELLRPRFEKFNIGENKPRLVLNFITKHLNPKTSKEEEIENFEGYSKRLDHRHHALDALIIACTKQNHILYINTMNAINTADLENTNEIVQKYKYLKEDVCGGKGSKVNKLPWYETSFVEDVTNVLQNVIIAHKGNNVIVSPSKNKNSNAKQCISVRGNLHKETNYAKKNYFDNEQLSIDKLIKKLLTNMFDNQNQTMILPRNFKQLIKELVFKEAIQKELIQLFEPFENIILNKNTGKIKNENTISVIEKNLLEKIKNDNLLFNSKENKPLEWVSVFSENRASNRPNGFYLDINSEKEVNAIIEPRVRRIANYRLAYVKQKEEEINKLALDKKEKDTKIRDIRAIKLFSNAIYELRLKNSDGTIYWKEIKECTAEDFNKISYPKTETEQNVKNKLSSINLTDYKKTYLENPLFTTNIPIEIKKARQKAWFQDLYELKPNNYVYSQDSTYFFVMQNEKKRNIIPLKFIDAIKILENKEKQKFTALDLLPLHLKTNEEEKLLFPLQNNDLVYIPDALENNENLNLEKLQEIDWADLKNILPKLYIVKEMNASGPGVVFAKLYTADAISLTEKNAREFFKNSELKGNLIEEIKYGTAPMLQRCIKVFTNRLGTKIEPYWKFPNGCWNKEVAKNLGLVNKQQYD
jgi:CRISPR-associated endonuclease Csn1